MVLPGPLPAPGSHPEIRPVPSEFSGGSFTLFDQYCQPFKKWEAKVGLEMSIRIFFVFLFYTITFQTLFHFLACLFRFRIQIYEWHGSQICCCLSDLRVRVLVLCSVIQKILHLLGINFLGNVKECCSFKTDENQVSCSQVLIYVIHLCLSLYNIQ